MAEVAEAAKSFFSVIHACFLLCMLACLFVYWSFIGLQFLIDPIYPNDLIVIRRIMAKLIVIDALFSTAGDV